MEVPRDYIPILFYLRNLCLILVLRFTIWKVTPVRYPNLKVRSHIITQKIIKVHEPNRGTLTVTLVYPGFDEPLGLKEPNKEKNSQGQLDQIERSLLRFSPFQ